jgi:predicted dehydrogenase
LEAEELIAYARRKDLKLTVGHNYQFSHAALRMRQLVERGYLGGPPVHLESYYGYDLGDVSYAKAVLGDHDHWVRRLPGGLLQNIISHGISKVAEFLHSDACEVLAYGFTSPLFQSIGEKEIVDELRVIIHDDVATAYFTFSSQMRPILHQLRLYGTKNGLIVDDDQQTMIKLKGTAYKSYLEQFVPPWNYAGQYIADALGNMKKFLKRNFHTGHGMRILMQTFYRSITHGTVLPIPYDDLLLTSRIMDEIFSQLYSMQNATRACQSRERLVENLHSEIKI